MAQDHLAAPTPLDEHRKLAAFAGTWSGEEMVYPSRWTAGGPATAEVVAVEGRRIEFRIDATDGIEQIGSGMHERIIIDRTKFAERLKAKPS